MQPHFQFILPTSSFSFQWLPELQHHAPGVPIVLAGTKLGELYDNESIFVSDNELGGTWDAHPAFSTLMGV
jgi:hypothetical protein